MLISHIFGEKKIEKEIDYKNPKMILMNKVGGFLHWQLYPESRYCGMHHRTNGHLFKSIENIELKNSSPAKKITNKFWSFDIEREDGMEESFFSPYGFNSMVYELNKSAAFNLILDGKEIFDNDEWGRNYQIYEQDGNMVIEFFKIQDEARKYGFFIAISGADLNFKKIQNWILRDYKYDFLRKDPPYSRYVFSALEIFGERVVFSISENKEEAIQEAEYVLNNLEDLKNAQQKYANDFSGKYDPGVSDKEIDMAYLATRFSADNMTVMDFEGNVKGAYAGLPWFSQFWARDILMSLNAFSTEVKKELFLNYLKEFERNGKISLCGSGCLNSADVSGLFFKRAEDLMSENLISNSDIFRVKTVLVDEIENLLKFKTREGFAVNGPKETWMDTDFKGDAREGERIEMQAMRLKMYNLAAKLTGERRYFKLEHDLSKKVREFFWDTEILRDGIIDTEIRPNIFLAFYFYPDLLHKHEWKKAFSYALDDLWLEWGGVASISKNSKMFCGEYRGCDELNQSYHHGDSWYFLNNTAALVLKKTDFHKYKEKIDKILCASTEEVLWRGALGHHAELSSASQFSSFGCFAQLWSAALYIEALDEIIRSL